FGLIYQILYGAWDQPSREAAGGRQVTARISLDARGNITQFEIASSSGVPELDNSVTLALRSVKRVPGLTDRFLKSHKHVTIAFEVQ
nr:TonB family protein [Nitrospinaceae bacterium]